MHVLSRLRKTLRGEFPTFSPDLVQALTRFVSGARTGESFEQYSDRITTDLHFDSEQEKQDFIYDFLLKMSRQLCKMPGFINLLQQTLEQSIAIVKARKENNPSFQHGSPTHSPIMFQSEKKRRLQDMLADAAPAAAPPHPSKRK